MWHIVHNSYSCWGIPSLSSKVLWGLYGTAACGVCGIVPERCEEGSKANVLASEGTRDTWTGRSVWKGGTSVGPFGNDGKLAGVDFVDRLVEDSMLVDEGSQRIEPHVFQTEQTWHPEALAAETGNVRRKLKLFVTQEVGHSLGTLVAEAVYTPGSGWRFSLSRVSATLWKSGWSLLRWG